MSRSTINRKTYILINDNVQNIYINHFSIFMCLGYGIPYCALWSTTSIHFYRNMPVKQNDCSLKSGLSPYGILRFSLFHNCHLSSSWNHKSFPVRLKVGMMVQSFKSKALMYCIIIKAHDFFFKSWKHNIFHQRVKIILIKTSTLLK